MADLPEEETVVAEEEIELVAEPDESSFRICRVDDESWQVEGTAIERAAQMTNWDYYEAAMRFQRILSALGIREALKEAGVEEGDRVLIADVELVWGFDNAFGE